VITANSFRKLVHTFDNVDEKPHFDKSSFRIKGKIFATFDDQKKCASLKLNLVDQSVYCQIKPGIALPATGAWGKQGWTIFDIKKTPRSILAEALKKAFLAVGPKEGTGIKSVKKNTEQIQTLHPDKSKTNKKISLEKYNIVKDNLLKILKKSELTHKELMERLYENIKDKFEGGIQWYGETVKLDLEARKIIERTGTKPDKYRLRATNR